MNPFRTAAFRVLAIGLALPLAALLWTAGCDVDSVDSTTAVVSDNEGNVYNYSGLYMSASNANGSTNGYASLVFPAGRQSGAALTWLRLLQYGSVLEGYDNVGLVWNGSISVQNGEIAAFSLSGRTTAGAAVEIAGTLTYASQLSTMDATWVEPSFSGSIFAQATVSPVVTSKPPSKLTLSPSSASLSTNNTTQEFTVSGGTEPYSWSASGGTVTPSTGKTVTYTTSYSSGSITVTDANSNSATATITYTASAPSGLVVSPTTMNLNTSTYKGTFKVTGGDGSYTWMVKDASLGSISSSSGSSVTYTSAKIIGTNTISVIDTDNRQASALAIYQ